MNLNNNFLVGMGTPSIREIDWSYRSFANDLFYN